MTKGYIQVPLQFFMKKTIYIIPGWGESCDEKRYKNLATTLGTKGCTIERIKPDWNLGITGNVFKPVKNSIIIGFSYGAVIAYLIAKKYKVKRVIFCSLSPIEKESYKDTLKDHLKYMSRELAVRNSKDIKSIKISLETLQTPYITLAGECEEGIKADFLAPKTGHYMSKEYINCIKKLLST